MQLEIFSIYDTKAHAYLTPFFLPTKEMAIRTFTNCANDPTHAFCQNPADYVLFHVGKFHDDSGTLLTPEIPKAIAHALELQSGSTRFDNIEEEMEVQSTKPFNGLEDLSKRNSTK